MAYGWPLLKCTGCVSRQVSATTRRPPAHCLRDSSSSHKRLSCRHGEGELTSTAPLGQDEPTDRTVKNTRPAFLPPEAVAAVQDKQALQMLQRIQRLDDDETICFYTGDPANIGDASRPALVLVHGFDSSSLEFRYLIPALEKLLPPHLRLFAVDVLGWGFGARPAGADYGPNGKRAHLQRFLRRVVDGESATRAPVFMAGASLGGAVVADYFLRTPPTEQARIQSVIFIDAQLFVDGKAFRWLVTPLDYLGLAILRSKALRRWANRLAFYRPELLATEDAMLIGRLHCLTSGWMEASRSFLRANGYTLSADLPKLAQLRLPVLAIWGAQDRIVPVDTLERLRSLYCEQGCESLLHVVLIPECGHLPHLERPEAVAVAIDGYLRRSLDML
ncbi:hypothetical protein CCYA_CCYA02G0741 [Cyanidiococcus yangmingshanensis]|nr:hypothetical protein CCYA_CCYA02G0741 [Cyanidiococcus yangmingshanensis]